MADSKEILGRITGVKVYSKETQTWSDWKTSDADIYKTYTLPQVYTTQGDPDSQLLYRIEYDTEDWEARRLTFYGNASYEYHGPVTSTSTLGFVNPFDNNDYTGGGQKVIIANTGSSSPYPPDRVQQGETKQLRFYGVLGSINYFTGGRTVYFDVHGSPGTDRDRTSTFQAVKCGAIVVPPQLTISALPTNVTAGNSVTINAQNRSDLILHYRFTANNQTLYSGDAYSDNYQVNTNVSWFNAAGLTSDSMDVEVTASDDYSRTASVEFRLLRPQALSVTPVAPKSTTIDGGQSIPFTWSVSGGNGTQSSASLQYSYDNINWSSLGDISGEGTTLAKSAGFFNAGTVYWRIRVKNTYNVWSEYASASFTVKYDTPTVEQETPISGNIDISTAIQFRWTVTNGSGSVTGTQMETSVDNGATWVSRVNSTTSVTTYNASAGAFPAGAVKWRVRVKDQYAGWSDWEQSNFTITAVLPVVTLTAPTSGTKDGGTAIPFNWTITQGSGNITGTQMEYSIDEGVTWTQLVNSSSSVVTYTAIAGKFPAGNLRWRVRAKDQFTGWADWKTASITIKYDTPTVTLTAPTSGSFDIGASINFVWAIAAGSGSITGTQMETSVDDGVTWVNRLDSNKSSTSISTAAGTFPVGAVKWRVRAKDQYAGWSSWKQATITITVSLPVVTLISPTSGSREGGNDITFAWSFENGSGTINGVQFSTSIDDGVTWTKRLDKAEAQTSFIASPKTFPPGALKWRVRSKDSYAGWGAWKTASVTIEYAATSYVVQTNSPTGGNVNASAPITFACTLETDGVPYAPFTMQSATFYWRIRTADSYTAVQMTPSGANASVTISRNTFPAGSINWYIEATDSAGTTTETPVYTISTLASAIDAQPISPVNTVEISNDVITFTWKYASTSGDPQNGAEVRYSLDGETWTTLPRISGTNTSVTVPPDTFHSGPVYWQVRAFNSAGTAGDWSAIVQFVAFGAPEAPSVTADAVPFATIRWQGAGQVSYEVKVDGTVYGPFLGEEKAYSLFDYLEDGSHKARVRILGSAGLWSLWGEVTFNVSNGSQAALTLDAKTDIDTELTWSGGSGTYYVYRDRKLIARTNGNSFTDRTALGIHEYRVIKRLANGKYNASPIVTRTMEVRYMHIAALDGGSWIEIQHTLKSSSDPSYDYSALTEYNHMDNSEFPLVSVGPYLDESASYSAVFLYNEQEEHRRFCALFRKPVILKTSDDIVMIGFLDAWERSPKTSRGTKYYTAYTFKLQRIGWEDFIDDTQ